MWFELGCLTFICLHCLDCHPHRIWATLNTHPWCTQAAVQRHKHPTKSNLPSAQEAEAMLYLDRDMFTPQVGLRCDLKVVFLACALMAAAA